MFITMLHIAYSVIITLQALAYLPQIFELLRTTSDCRNFSLKMWGVWLASAIISLAYAIWVLGDLKFSLLNIANTLGISTIIFLTLRNRARNKVP